MEAERAKPSPSQTVRAEIHWLPGVERSEPNPARIAELRHARHAENVASRVQLERVYGVGQRSRIETASSRSHFTPRDHSRIAKLVREHPSVQPLLTGRSNILGVDEVWTRSSAEAGDQTVRVHLFNYTTNQLIDVCVVNDQVTTVDQRGVHEYPESPFEVATAITLARRHPALQTSVAGLEGRAILRVPTDARSGLAGRRCMWVMFTERNDPSRELPVLRAALVDLGSSVVVPVDETTSTTGGMRREGANS